MNASRVAAIVLRQLFLYRGSPQRVLPMFAWVALDIVLWGFISRYLSVAARPGVNFVATLLGAVLLWDFLTRVMQGVTMAFFEDVWSRNFLGVFASPLSIVDYVAGLVLTGVVSSLIGLAVMIAIAALVFGLSFASYGLAIVPCLFALFLFGIALGVTGAALVLRLGPAAEWLVWPIPAVLAPFACVYYPLATLPAWMHPLSAILPPTYVFEAIRSIAAGGPPHYEAITLALALAALYILAAGALFAYIHRLCVRTGLIARYSAESVT
jgi:ABC-2 type transport system permease protein